MYSIQLLQGWCQEFSDTGAKVPDREAKVPDREAKLGGARACSPEKNFIICRSKIASPSFSAANNRNSWQVTAFILRSIDVAKEILICLAKSIKSALLISSWENRQFVGELRQENSYFWQLTIKKTSKLLFTFFNR